MAKGVGSTVFFDTVSGTTWGIIRRMFDANGVEVADATLADSLEVMLGDGSQRTVSRGTGSMKFTDADVIGGGSDAETIPLVDLSDVDTVGATSGQALVYDGSGWAPGTVGVDAIAYDEANFTTAPTASGTDSLAIGDGASATSTGGIAIGLGAATATGVAIGRNATTSSGISSFAGAYYASATGNYSVSIGRNSAASGVSSVALGGGNASGAGATASGLSSVSIGEGSKAAGWGGIALGVGADAKVSDFATAIGRQASAGGNNSLALGRNASTAAHGAVAIGADSGGIAAKATVSNEFILGTASHNVKVPGTFEVTTADAGVILASPNGTRYRVSVDDAGNLTTVAA